MSGSTLAALQEFYAERNDEERRADDLKSAIETGQKLSMDMFKEDWNASQFWVKSGRLLLAKKLTMEVQRRHGKDPSETATG